ncbi:MAG: hypothetical protein H6Q16_416 [Bacteroidetes bacterium]|nr:hypothetical protein [Bacteroidota bacterium]
MKIGKELAKLNIQSKRIRGIRKYLLIKKDNADISRESEGGDDDLEEAI